MSAELPVHSLRIRQQPRDPNDDSDEETPVSPFRPCFRDKR